MNYPKHKLSTEFDITYTYDSREERFPPETLNFKYGMEVYVIAKARDNPNGGSLYIIYSPELRESATVHEMFLVGFKPNNEKCIQED